MCCSTPRESERTGGRRALFTAFRFVKDGFRGGSGGTFPGLVFGGDSRLMSGAGELGPRREPRPVGAALLVVPFANLPL